MVVGKGGGRPLRSRPPPPPAPRGKDRGEKSWKKGDSRPHGGKGWRGERRRGKERLAVCMSGAVRWHQPPSIKEPLEGPHTTAGTGRRWGGDVCGGNATFPALGALGARPAASAHQEQIERMDDAAQVQPVRLAESNHRCSRLRSARWRPHWHCESSQGEGGGAGRSVRRAVQ